MTDRKPAYLIAAALLLVDQLSKFVITGPLGLRAEGDQMMLLPIFNFTFVRNKGISLGLLHADGQVGRWLLVAATSAIAVAILWWIGREKHPGERAALGLVLGGALGNIADRARLGYVVDFLDLHFGAWRPFYVFNVADAAISVGVVILLLRALFAKKATEEIQDHA